MVNIAFRLGLGCLLLFSAACVERPLEATNVVAGDGGSILKAQPVDLAALHDLAGARDLGRKGDARDLGTADGVLDLSQAAPGAPGTCDEPDGPVVAVPHDKILSTLVGRWQLCTGMGIFNSSSKDFVGVEFDQDGSFSYLIRSAAGSLIPSSGFGNGGTYYLLDGDNNVYFQFNDGSTGGFFPSFELSPRKFHENDFESTYIAIQ